MLKAPPPIFQAIQDSRSNPATTAGFTSILLGSGAKGSWVQVGSVLSSDAFGVQLVFGNGGPAGQDNSMLLDMGVDPAGGTGFAVQISNLLTLGALDTGGINVPNPVWFFPLYLKAGSSIGIRGQIKGAAQSILCAIRLFQKPLDPSRTRLGSFVDPIGIDSVNTKGVALTKGTPDSRTQGAWTLLGTAPRDAWWFQAGFTINASSLTTYGCVDFALSQQDTNNLRRLMVGKASVGAGGKGVILQPHFFESSCLIKAGDSIWARYITRDIDPDTWTVSAYLAGG